MAYALEMQQKRKAEEAARAAEAARMNAALRAQEKAYAEYQAWVKAQRAGLEAELRAIESADTPALAPGASVTDITEAERLAAYRATPQYQAYQARMRSGRNSKQITMMTDKPAILVYWDLCAQRTILSGSKPQ